MVRKCHLEEHSEEYIRFMNATEHSKPRPKVHFPDLESLASMSEAEARTHAVLTGYLYGGDTRRD